MTKIPIINRQNIYYGGKKDNDVDLKGVRMWTRVCILFLNSSNKVNIRKSTKVNNDCHQSGNLCFISILFFSVKYLLAKIFLSQKDKSQIDKTYIMDSKKEGR